MKTLDIISGSEIESIKERINFNYFSGKRVLITGGAGMLGSWLATSIVSATNRDGTSKTIVDIVSRRSNPKNLFQALQYSNCNYIQGDIESSNLQGYDLLIHAASPASPTNFGSIESMNSVNSGPMAKLVESSPNLDQFIFISTGEVYGKSAPLLVDEAFNCSNFGLSDRSAYPLSKLAAEIELLKLAKKHSFVPGIVRLFHSFGPGVSQKDGRSFADFIWNAARNETIKLHTEGNQVRSILYLEDAVVGILSILTKRFATPINVGSSIPITIKQLAHLIALISKVETPITCVNNDYEPSSNNLLVPSNNLLKALGWDQRVSLETTIKRTLAWCKSMNSEEK